MTAPAIRPAGSNEHQQVAECVGSAYSKYISRIGKKPAPMLADYQALIAENLVHVIAGPTGIDAVLVIEVRPDHFFVENVAVHPDRQGQGLGKRLMKFAEEQAKRNGLNEIHLYTHAMMTENLTFYPQLGYEVIERRTEDGYDRVFMRKLLD